MNAKNEIEKIALEMLAAGKPVHGKLREILTEMQLREMEDWKIFHFSKKNKKNTWQTLNYML